MTFEFRDETLKLKRQENGANMVAIRDSYLWSGDVQ